MSIPILFNARKNMGLIKNGLIALYDPYMDTLGVNILPVGANTFTTASGWSAYSGETITVTGGQTDSFGGTNAYRIQGNGIGSSTLKYLTSTVAVPSTTIIASCVYIKNNGTANVTIRLNASTNRDAVVAPGAGWMLAVGASVAAGTSLNLRFYTANISDQLNILVYQPQINFGSLAPYSAPSGLPQSLTDRSYHGNNAQLGSAPSTDTNDPTWTGTAVQHATNQYCLSPVTTMDMRSFSELITGKFNGSSGVIFSFADPTSATKYQAIKNPASGFLSIISRNGGSETESAQLAVSTTNSVALLFTAFGGVLTLTNLSMGTSVTLADTAPTTAPRIGIGCVAGSTVAQVTNGMTWNNCAPYNHPLPQSQIQQNLKYIRKLEAGRGVTVS